MLYLIQDTTTTASTLSVVRILRISQKRGVVNYGKYKKTELISKLF